jgi:hypothetical protein
MSAKAYFQTEPCLALQPCLEHLWLVETFETDERLNDPYRVLPDGQIDILFRAKRGGRCEIDVVGPMTKAQRVRSKLLSLGRSTLPVWRCHRRAPARAVRANQLVNSVGKPLPPRSR